MKKLIFRILAFGIDTLIIYIILFAFSLISFINPNRNLVATYSKQESDLVKEYSTIESKLDDILSDKKINNDEMEDLRTNYNSFIYSFSDVRLDMELSDDDITSIRNDIKDTYNNRLNYYIYSISLNNTNITIIQIIVSILYLGIFEWFMKGKTIGKMIFRLKTVDNTNIKRKIPIWKYIIKSILISEAIFNIIDIIVVNNISIDSYVKFIQVLNNIRYIYDVLFIILMVVRDDQRSLHDLLLNTRVSLFDKNGKEVKSVIFNEETSN